MEPRKKIYEHLAIRPETFKEFRKTKSLCGYISDNEFIIELLLLWARSNKKKSANKHPNLLYNITMLRKYYNK
jgi:hypothetical protein